MNQPEKECEVGGTSSGKVIVFISVVNLWWRVHILV